MGDATPSRQQPADYRRTTFFTPKTFPHFFSWWTHGSEFQSFYFQDRRRLNIRMRANGGEVSALQQARRAQSSSTQWQSGVLAGFRADCRLP